MNNSNELHLAIDDGFIGSPYSPRVDITETDSGHEISITSKKPEGIVTDTLEIPDADWQRAEDAREAAESSRVRAENSRKAEWDVISADATSATSAANDAADSANQAADAANAAAESATDAESDLRAAAARGDFDGFSPVVDIDDGASSHTITITDREGDHSYTVPTYAAEESARAAAETARVSAESNRVSAESLRVSAEGLRASAESSRAIAETGRASAESSRRSAENSRVIAETSRANAESSRVSAETARAQAETARDEAEGLRDSDEQARVSAETARATEWAEIESDAQSTIDAAQDATQDATDAAAMARAASAATWLSGNVLFGELAEAAVLTSDDAFAAPPESVDVYGVSTQAGTPTPDAPVEIKSVDDLTLHVCGKNLLPIPDGSISGSGNSVRNAFNAATAELTFVDGHQYTVSMDISADSTTGYFRLQYLYADGTTTLSGWFSSSTSNMSLTSTAGKSVESLSLVSYNNSAPISLYNIQLEIGSTATAYAPYVGQSIPIPLSDHIARSLPNGTRDTLTLSYIGPSTEHEGWGVFSKTLMQRVDNSGVISSGANYVQRNLANTCTNVQITLSEHNWPIGGSVLSTQYKETVLGWRYLDAGEIRLTGSGVFIGVYATFANSAAANAWLAEHPFTFDYPLATPITHDLGTIELPILPNPLTAWADGGSAQTTMQLEYERALSIVIPRIEAAISDLATS